nr:hypothetical protein [uncultured Campylobacter sp.]
MECGVEFYGFTAHGVKFEIPQNTVNFRKFHKILRSPEILKAPQI